MSLTFKVLPKGEYRTVKRKVTFTYATQNGNTVEQGFNAHFKLLPESELNAILNPDDAGKTDDTSASFLLNAMLAKNAHKKLMGEVWTGWDGIMTEGKSGKDVELPFSEEALASLLDDIAVREAVVASYFDALHGRKSKN
ncbi:hypothetical protein [Pyruvatibacter sp.]|uniref:hypothetical protein n=1 Tax=Pyruvatibacter sp. TaxID=1981328 RepID=UPI0032EFD819